MPRLGGFRYRGGNHVKALAHEMIKNRESELGVPNWS